MAQPSAALPAPGTQAWLEQAGEEGWYERPLLLHVHLPRLKGTCATPEAHLPFDIRMCIETKNKETAWFLQVKPGLLKGQPLLLPCCTGDQKKAKTKPSLNMKNEVILCFGQQCK